MLHRRFNTELLVLGTQSEVSHFDCGEVGVVPDQNIVWLQVSVDDVVAVHVLHGLQDTLHDLSTLFVSEPSAFCFALLDQVSKGASFHELHA